MKNTKNTITIVILTILFTAIASPSLAAIATEEASPVSPTPTLTVEPSPTVVEITPTATPSPTITSIPVPMASPSASPVPTASPTATPSPSPTPTPELQCTLNDIYLTKVESVQLGLRNDGGIIIGDRSRSQNGLGSPDWRFLSLGLGGTATYSFSEPVIDTDGADLTFYEVTGGNRSGYMEELASFSVSADGITWKTFATRISSRATGGINTYDLAEVGLEQIQYVRIIDETVPNTDPYADGIEVDAVSGNVERCTKVPSEPTATPTPLPTNTPTPSPTPVNQPPVANAGEDITITLPDVAQLEGSIIDDGLVLASPKGTWRLVTGPGIIEWLDLGSSNPRVRFKDPGTYTFEFKADDGEYVSTDTVIITVLPEPEPTEPPDTTPVIESVVVDDGMLCFYIPFLGTICLPDVTITGENFTEGATVEYREAGSTSWVPVSSATIASETTITATVGYVKANRSYDLRLTTSASESVVLLNAFTTQQ
jgi:hypothetical protein